MVSEPTFSQLTGIDVDQMMIDYHGEIEKYRRWTRIPYKRPAIQRVYENTKLLYMLGQRVTSTRVAELSGISPNAAYNRLRKLKERGLVKSTKFNKVPSFKPTGVKPDWSNDWND